MINQSIETILFIDIETAPVVERCMDLSEHLSACWTKKKWSEAQQRLNLTNEPIDVIYQKLWMSDAALMPEFSQVICVVAGLFTAAKGDFVVRRFTNNPSEESMLAALATTLSNSSKYVLCGHNIKEFDIPFLCKRYIINGLEIPSKINFVGRKPWEIDVIDTMDIWRFGVYKSYTGLNLLAAALNIPSPKQDMDGSMVGEEFFKGNIQKISDYCCEDVIAVAKVVRRFKNMTLDFEVINK